MSTCIFEAGNATLVGLQFLESTKKLPFPLNLHLYARISISVFFTFVLTIGIYLRKNIFDYLKSPETKLGPINLLIWMDQAWITLL